VKVEFGMIGPEPGPVGGRSGTRERILVSLRRHGGRTAPQLARELGLSAVGVRRHLTAMERDGLVSSSTAEPGRGRPPSVYQLTDAGLERFPRHYDQLAHEALSFLGADDGARLRQFLAWRNDRLAASYGDRVTGETIDERAHALAEALNEQGFMADVEPATDGLRICQHNCTVEHIATEHPDVCASETELFERLLGAPVVRETTIVNGDVRCVTRVRTTGSSRASAEAQHPGPSTPRARDRLRATALDRTTGAATRDDTRSTA
jgi:predicted ArsR family transcriptional regulator